MTFELFLGIGMLVLGVSIIVMVAIAREHPLVYLSGLGVAAMGASTVVAETISPGPAQIGVRSFFWIVSILAFLFQWRMARRLPRRETPDQKSGVG